MGKKKSNIKTVLESVFNSLRSNKKSMVILILVISITVLSLNSLFYLKVNPKWSNALPQADTLVNEYLTLVEDSLRGSIAYALIEGPEKEKLADEFSCQVSKLPWIRFVFDGRIKISETETSIFSFNEQRLLQHLAITENININQLVNLFKERLKRYLAVSNILTGDIEPTENWNQFLLALLETLRNKPLSQMDEIIDNMFFSQGSRIRSNDNESLLLLIGTDISEGSIDKIDTLCDSLNSINTRILKKYSQANIKLTGYPITARDEMQNISTSGKRMTIWALFIVTAVLIFFYRDWKFVAASLGILCISIMWTLTLNQSLFGELNTVTLIMGLILIGLGIDFSIHWINYKITNNELMNKEKLNSKDYWSTIAMPILAGAFTTASSFLVLLLLKVKSINEFGLMSFFGILLVAILILLLMPMLTNKSKNSSAYAYIRTKIQQVVHLVINHEKKVLILGIVFIGGGICLLPKLKYEYNYAKLQIGDLQSYKVKSEINEKFGFASDVFLNRTTGIQNADEIKKNLESSNQIGHVLSISDYIPTTENKLNNANIVKEINKATKLIKINELTLNDLNSLKNDLEKISYLLSHILTDSTNITETLLILKKVTSLLDIEHLKALNRFNRNFVESFINRMNKFTTNNQPGIENLQEKLHYLFETSRPNEFVQYIYPINDTWEKENIESLEPILSEITPLAVGLSRISYHISNWIIDKVITITIASFFVILFTLLVTQKNWKYATIAILPVSLGILFTLATLSLLNIKVSIYNLIGLPIILGIGIDNGIHLVHAHRQNFKNGAQKAFLKVGPALFLTALTSMIGFGFLSFYTHPGISSLGVVAFIGIGWCFITTILFLPIVINQVQKYYPDR